MSTSHRKSLPLYPHDEIIFKKLYALCNSYIYRINRSCNPEPALLKKRALIEHFLNDLERLAKNNNLNNDAKISAIAERLEEIKEGLSTKRGIGKAAPFFDAKGKELVKAMEELIVPRMQIANLIEEKDIYFLSLPDEKSQFQFNPELMTFLKGKKVYLVNSADPESSVDYDASLCSDTVKELETNNVKVLDVYMPMDVWRMDYAKEAQLNKDKEAKRVAAPTTLQELELPTRDKSGTYIETIILKRAKKAKLDITKDKLGATYRQDVVPLEQAVRNAKAVLSQEEYQACEVWMDVRLLGEFKKLAHEKESWRLEDLLPLLERNDAIAQSFPTIDGAFVRAKIEKYVASANSEKQSDFTVRQFLDYLEKKSKTPNLSKEKLAIFETLRLELSAYRQAKFHEQMVLTAKKLDKKRPVYDPKDLLDNVSKGPLYRAAMERLQPSKNERVIVVDSHQAAHVAIQSVHDQRGYSHGLLTLSQLTDQFTASVGYKKPLMMMQFELQAMLGDERSLSMLKDARRDNGKVKSHNQSYFVPPDMAAIISLLQNQPLNGAASDAYRGLLTIKNIAHGALHHNTHGVANAFYQVIAEGLKNLETDPSQAQKELSKELFNLENAMSEKSVTGFPLSQKSAPKMVFWLKLDNDIVKLSKDSNQLEIDDGLLETLDKAKEHAEQNGLQFVIELLVKDELIDKLAPIALSSTDVACNTVLSKPYENIVMDRERAGLLHSQDVFYYFDYSRDQESLAQTTHRSPHLKALEASFIRGKLEDKKLDQVLYDQALLQRIKNHLLDTTNLRNWADTSASQHAFKRKVGSLFLSTPTRERVIIRQPAGNIDLYILPEPIAKMVLLALHNEDEKLCALLRSKAQQTSCKLGDQQSHDQLLKYLRAVLERKPIGAEQPSKDSENSQLHL